MAQITQTQFGLHHSGSLLAALQAVLKRLGSIVRTRRTLDILDRLDDHALRDIGLVRSDLVELKMATSAELASAIGRIRFRR